MKTKSLKLVWVAAALVGAVVVSALNWAGARTRLDAAVSPTTTVIRRDMTSSVLATGTIGPQVGAEVRVGARISGTLSRLHANIGDRVEKGQIIAELERADLEALVDQRQAELKIATAKLAAVESLRPTEIGRAEADLEQRRATALLADKEHTQQHGLFSQQLISAQDHERSQEKLSVARAAFDSAQKTVELVQIQYVGDLRQARAEVERAKAILASARTQLTYATITTSITGIVASVSTQEGETVAAGLSAPTFVTVIDLDRLQVDAFVDEVDIGRIHVGQQAVFTVDAFPAREFEGRVIAIYPKAVIQDNVVNYDVVIEVTSSYEGVLRPEMTASVTLLVESRPGVLAVPVSAVDRKSGKNIVYLRKGESVEQVEVQLGSRDEGWIEIARGLEEGQTILSRPPKTEETR